MLCFRTSFGIVVKLDDGFFVVPIVIVDRTRNILMVVHGCRISAIAQLILVSAGSFDLAIVIIVRDDESFVGMALLPGTAVALRDYEARVVIFAVYLAIVLGNVVRDLNGDEVDILTVHLGIKALVHEKVRSIN